MQLETAERKEEIEQWLEDNITEYYLSGQNVTDLLQKDVTFLQKVFLFAIFLYFPKFSKVKKLLL